MSTDLAIRPGFDRAKIDLIKETVAKGATDLELELFFHACQRTGLDPLMKQIYAIKRWSAADKREILSFQTGIDGYRLIADRTGQYAGSSDAIFEDADGHPRVAQVTVVKLVGARECSFTASARWDEYAQRNREGQLTAMWKKMPYLMLAKCAEALALRKAFPAELSGVYTHEEMMQVDTEPRPTVMDHKREAHAKIAELAREGAAGDLPVSVSGDDVAPTQSVTAPDAPSTSDNTFMDLRLAINDAIDTNAVNMLRKDAHDAKHKLTVMQLATLDRDADARLKAMRGKK